jgi:hypothetical protein
MRPELTGLRGAADADWLRSDAAQNITRPEKVQIVAIDGAPLSPRRHERIEGAPMLASSSIWRMARDRWLEVSA